MKSHLVDVSLLIPIYIIYLLIYFTFLQIHIVHDVNNGKPRGYAFIEYEHERDMHGMYQNDVPLLCT